MNYSGIFLLLLTFFFAIPMDGYPSPPDVVIQPFSEFDTTLITEIKKGIIDFYGKNITVTTYPGIKLPKTAWYAPRSRYRAEKLLTFLDSIKSGSDTKIIGLTTKDISTTKDKYVDWGIFGLGELGGTACVVSTFRLKKGVDKTVFLRRLLEIVNHELGHTFGLDHCPHKGCIMEDANGTIKTVDNSSGKLCDECRNWLRNNIGIQ